MQAANNVPPFYYFAYLIAAGVGDYFAPLFLYMFAPFFLFAKSVTPPFTFFHLRVSGLGKFLIFLCVVCPVYKASRTRLVPGRHATIGSQMLRRHVPCPRVLSFMCVLTPIIFIIFYFAVVLFAGVPVSEDVLLIFVGTLLGRPDFTVRHKVACVAWCYTGVVLSDYVSRFTMAVLKFARWHWSLLSTKFGT